VKKPNLKTSMTTTLLVRNLSFAVIAGLALYTSAVVLILKDYSTPVLVLIAMHGILFASCVALTYRRRPGSSERARFFFVSSSMTLITLLSLMWEKDTGLQQLLLFGMITSGFIFPRKEKRQRRFAETTFGLLYIVVEAVIVFSQSHSFASLRLANAVILVTGGLMVLRWIRGKLETQSQTLALSEKQNKALLNSMLPLGPKNSTEHWPLGMTDKLHNVSVLFADLQGYTKLSERYDDVHIVSILDDLYSLFDSLAIRYGIEKLKTNGDEYMAAVGIPSTLARNEVGNAHTVETLCSFAQDMLQSFRTLSEARELGCNIRIGIATGSVIGGIIGTHKPYFDIWGKTVNRAARLEQASIPGTITVCARTRGHLTDSQNTQFDFSDRFVVGDNLVAHTLIFKS